MTERRLLGFEKLAEIGNTLGGATPVAHETRRIATPRIIPVQEFIEIVLTARRVLLLQAVADVPADLIGCQHVGL
jgi:hypothetical protein